MSRTTDDAPRWQTDPVNWLVLAGAAAALAGWVTTRPAQHQLAALLGLASAALCVHTLVVHDAHRAPVRHGIAGLALGVGAAWLLGVIFPALYPAAGSKPTALGPIAATVLFWLARAHATTRRRAAVLSWAIVGAMGLYSLAAVHLLRGGRFLAWLEP